MADPVQHIKPSKEELEENIRKSQEELDKLDAEEKDAAEKAVESLELPEDDKEEEDDNNPPADEKPEDEGEPDGGEEDEEIDVDDIIEQDPPEEKPEEKPEDKKEEKKDGEDPDYKKKFSDSSREAQKLSAKNRVLDQAYREASELPEPTEEELKAAYSNWDEFDDDAKDIHRELLINKRFRERIKQGTEQAKKIEHWEKQVEDFIDNPETLIKNPKLEGKQAAFTEFATQEENNNVPFNVLVTSFLYQESQKPKPKHKGAMFETPTGGENRKPGNINKKLSIEDSEILRKTNYAKYSELLKAGKISTTLE